jgi:putative DNA primase/helicase
MIAVEALAAKVNRQLGVVAAPEAPLLQALDVFDLARHQFKPRETLLAPVLHTQDLMMVFAARGIGKTHFAIAIAYAVASGGKFLRWHAPVAKKVVYFDGELPGSVLQGRMLMHCPDTEPAPGMLKVFTPDLLPDGVPLPDLATPDGQDVIESMIEPDTALVVIDNLSA